jgi:predicted PurR-regulated permease PerM
MPGATVDKWLYARREQIYREAEVTQGLILLALIAAFFALLTTRVRRRLGLSSSGRTWMVAMVVVIVIVLALWNGSSR